MSSNWSQEGPPQMGGNTMRPSLVPPVSRPDKPTVTCFVCSGPHFVVDCPKSQQNNRAPSAGFVSTPAPYQQAPAPAPPQSYPPQNGPAQYPPYQNQQYGPAAQQYAYTQPQPYTAPAPAPYTAPSPAPQYPRTGYQPPNTYNQYNQSNGPPQFNAPYQPPAPQYNARGPPSYQAPVNNYPPQNNAYGAPYQPPQVPVPYQQPPQSQWNNPSSSSQPAFPRPQRSNSGFQRAFSNTPSNHSQQHQPLHRSKSQQQDIGSEAVHRTPQTPSSVSGKIQQVSHQNSPAKPAITSVPPTPASNSNIRKNSLAPSITGNMKLEQAVAKGKEKEKVAAPVDQETEEGEVCEGDDEEELFNWDLEKIFKEPPTPETVALAQPLSAGYESTPVPLVQAWTTNVPSISRYARKDNLKEFVKSVRVAPQWSYLQEDPAFAEVSNEGELIPLSDIWAWMDVHHGRTITVEEVEEPAPAEHISKKRSRPESENDEQEDVQEDVDEQLAHEAAVEEVEEPPNKRQKNEEDDDSDELLASPSGRTPIINRRGGTPCLPVTDDAWAPQPGECAASPGDPTENLLASLGVSGDAKPVSKEPLPPYISKEEHSSSPQSSQKQTPVATNKQSFQGNSSGGAGPSAQNMTQNMPQNQGPPLATGPQGNPQYGPPVNAPYGHGNIPNPLYNQGPPVNNYQGVPQGPPQYGPPMNAPYGNGPTHNMNGPQQYGPPVNAPYNNGPPNSYTQGPPQGPPQWGPQRNPSYGAAPQFGPPQQYPQQYGPPQTAPYNNGPSYGPPVNQYSAVPSPQYPQGPPQYQQGRQPSYGSGPPMAGQYGPMAQTSPTQYGPPQNIPYNGAPYPNQPPYQNGPVTGYGNGPPNGPPNNVQYPNMPPNANMPPNQLQYVNGQNGQPPRQDSGYVSERGSYSSGSGPNGYANQANPQNSAQNPAQPPQGQPLAENLNEQTPRPKETKPQVKTEDSTNSNESFESNENAESSPGTPLSPTSAEILGKLVRKSSKGKTGQSGSVRKVKKRPQPVVAEAYSRRW